MEKRRLMKNSITYKTWLWLGDKVGVLKEHNIMVGRNFMDTYKALSEAFTPELQQMLEKNSDKNKR